MSKHNVTDPLKDAIAQIIGKVPPFEFAGAYKFSDLPAEAQNGIEDWCSNEICQCEYAEWATGSSIVSAAEQMVLEAQWDDNIPGDPLTKLIRWRLASLDLPKDGEEVLVWTDTGRIVMAEFHDFEDKDDLDYYWQPIGLPKITGVTHWARVQVPESQNV